LRLPPLTSSGTKHIYGLCQLAFCLGVPTAPRARLLPEGEGERRSRPRNSTVPPGGRSKRRAGPERSAPAPLVTPAHGLPVRCWLGRRAALAKSLRCSASAPPVGARFKDRAPGGTEGLHRQATVSAKLSTRDGLPARRAAGQSSRARSGTVTHGSIAGFLSAKQREDPKDCAFLRLP
jgi:hypothetical protein